MANGPTATYAMHADAGRGRRYAEPEHGFRTPYQRDRDRIVHASAFRRLMHKTQVLVNAGDGEHRTRLTHTLEVAQIARTIARQLRLNEDLTEAIALMHDLGHPPFGHAGERALDECMQEHGGFEHNRQALRIVELLEDRYPDFPGLNLSYEVLQAQAQHSKRPAAPEVAPYLDGGQPLLEAQVVDAADSIAYTCHDIDDALVVGLLAADELAVVPLWEQTVEQVRQRHPRLAEPHGSAAVIRTLIDRQVTDLLDCTAQNLRRAGVRSVADVRTWPEPLVQHSPEMQMLRADLESFLRARVYRHERVLAMASDGQRSLRLLFTAYARQSELLPERWRGRAQQLPLEQAVSDYLASLTDRQVQDQFARLFQPTALR